MSTEQTDKPRSLLGKIWVTIKGDQPCCAPGDPCCSDNKEEESPPKPDSSTK